MHNTGFIISYWKKQYQLFNKYFSVLRKYPETCSVREIRTTIKKLRATCRLHRLMTGEEQSNYPFDETEDLFSVLGIQRDIEITFEILKTFEKDAGSAHPELKRCLRPVLKISRKWTSQAVKKYKKKELAIITRFLQPGSSTDNEEAKDKLLYIIESSLIDCKKYLKEPHKLRQYLKEIYYWIKMGQEYLSIQLEYSEDVHSILNALGNWRNLRVFRARIRHSRKDYLPRSFKEYGLVKDIEADAKKKAEEFLKIALVEIKQLLKKIDPNKK